MHGIVSQCKQPFFKHICPGQLLCGLLLMDHVCYARAGWSARRFPGASSLLAGFADILEHSIPQQGERAYYRLRLERTNKKHLGRRTKRAAEAEAAEKDKAK